MPISFYFTSSLHLDNANGLLLQIFTLYGDSIAHSVATNVELINACTMTLDTRYADNQNGTAAMQRLY